MSETWENTKSWFGAKRDQAADATGIGLIASKPDYCPSLSWSQRLYGFCICAGIGIICAILGTVILYDSVLAFGF